ncbi:MAG: hypothetical protein AAF821_16970 [Cyanobacteria bacterium P01_D01_bin.156]
MQVADNTESASTFFYRSSANIVITNRTIRVYRGGNDEVYQLINVTGFSTYNKEIRKTYAPTLRGISIVVVLAILSYAYLSDLPNKNTILMACIFGIFLLITEPPERSYEYGLAMYFNSGDSKVFVTHDLDGVRGLVKKLSSAMERESSFSYFVQINKQSVNVNYRYQIDQSVNQSGQVYYDGDQVLGNKNVQQG